MDVEGDDVVALGLTARSFAEEVYKLNLELSQLLLVQRLESYTTMFRFSDDVS